MRFVRPPSDKPRPTAALERPRPVVTTHNAVSQSVSVSQIVSQSVSQSVSHYIVSHNIVNHNIVSQA